MAKMSPMEKGKSIAKILGEGSVQIMMGGVVAAVLPSGVGVACKAIAYVGACIVAACLTDPIDSMIDKKFDATSDAIRQIKKDIEILKSTEEIEIKIEKDKEEDD